MTISTTIAIAVGGFIGAFGRSFLSRVLANSTFPLATFIVNVVGSFGFGIIVIRQEELPQWISSLLLVGLFGSLTTFSTMILDAFALSEQKGKRYALWYLTVSIITSIASCACAILLFSTN